MAFLPFAGTGLQLLAATPVAGVALQNGTPTFLSYTFPNDGNQHRAVGIASLNVGTAETGGGVALSVVPPAGGAPAQPAVLAGSQAAGNHVGQASAIAGAGTTVSIVQTTALTAGAATAWFEIWGS